MKSPSNRSSRSLMRSLKSRLKRRKHRQGPSLGSERLEQRAMMAIFTYAMPSGTTLVAIDGNAGLTDVFLRGRPGGVEVATNSRFDPVATFDSADWTNPQPQPPAFNDNLHFVGGSNPLYITNATPNSFSFDLETNGFADGDASNTTDFSLSNGNINTTTAGAVVGEVRLGDRRWTFTNDANGGLLFTQIAGPAGGPSPRDRLSTISPGVTQPDLRGQGVRGAITIQWTGQVSTFVDDCPRLDVSYTYRNFIGLLPPNVTPPPDLTGFDVDLGVSAGSLVGFSIVGGNVKEQFGGVTLDRVPGTVVNSGTITVHDVSRIGASGSAREDLTFTFSDADGSIGFTPQQSDWLAIAPGSTLEALRFVNAFEVGDVPAGRANVSPGRVTISGTQTWFEYKIETRPSQVTVWPGLDVRNAITVEMTRDGGSLNVLSPIVNAGSLAALGTTFVNFQSPISVNGVITLGGGSVPRSLFPQVQTARIDAPNAASSYSFTIVGDSLTVGPSGSLSGALPNAAGDLTTPSAAVNALMLDADLVALGSIYATTQFYDLKSTTASYNRNTRFTTQTDIGGPDSGVIRGGTVVVAMANPGAVDVPPDGMSPDISVHTVSLRTDVDAFRTRAASTGSEFPDQNNYPYDLSIREADAITIDAVAGSGRPISISAGGSIIMGGGLSTVGDVTLEALSGGINPSLLSVAGPLATTRGKVRLIGDGVAIGDSVRVTSADADEFRDDIWITANAGDVELAGEVSAINRVKIQQFSGQRLVDRPVGNREALPIGDTQTVTQTIEVTDTFSFLDLDVEIDISHSFVGDLVGTLIAPDERRFTLFRRVGGSGDDFGGTIFDSEASTPIASGVAPFTGRFRPVDSLEPLYGGLSSGTWRLEIQDAAAGDTGTLDNFTLRFRVLDAAAAKVYGPAVVSADSLLLDVQGVVGDSSLQPRDLGFFLRTNVDTISGSIGGSASIDELNDVAIPSLRAGGFVSLRANGADPTSGANAGNAALQANLVDITGLDVAAPRGSLDVLFNTSKNVELGNAQALRNGRSLNSVAAGDVSIRSVGGGIIALDGPVAGGNGRAVRVATTAALSSGVNGQTLSSITYSPGNPGITASTLRGRGDLNAWLGVQIQPLRAGEYVLVKNQANPAQNGVYILSFMSTTTWSTATTWTLMRAPDADTAAELPSNTFVRIGEQQAGGVNQVGTWQITANYISLNGATANVSESVVAGSGSIPVTAGTAADVRQGMVVFGAGIAPDTTVANVAGTTITLSQATTADIAANAQIKFVAPAVARQGKTGSGLDDVFISELSTTADLQVGMLVVGQGIKSDTVISAILNATTVVLSQGAETAGSALVKFIRPFMTRSASTTAASTTVSGLTEARALREGMVVVGPGIPADTTIASIVNSTTIELSRQATESASGVSLKFFAATPTNFGLAPITVAPRPVTTDIGSDNPNSLLTFVVSTNAGTNSAAGSLGKMITLRQQNIAKLGNDASQPAGSQPMEFRFSTAVATEATPIRLTQELPEITKAFTISGSSTYDVGGSLAGKAAVPLIDGSRITHTRSGRRVAAGDIVNGLTVSGAAASGTVIRNVNIGGFGRAVAGVQSAAVDVRNAAGVLVRNVTAGLSELGIRLANGVGVRFSGSGVTSGTLLNSKVYGSNNSGLVVENNASGVSVVGSTFGRADNFNAVGATLSSGVNQFGVDPVSTVRPIPQVSAVRMAANRITLPANWPSASRLVPGLQILGASVVPTSGNAQTTISAVSTDARTGVTTVTVSGGNVIANGMVTFVANDPTSIPDAPITRVENLFTVPADTRLVVGMQLSGLPIKLLPGSSRATISAIRTEAGVTTVTVAGGTVVGNGTVTFSGSRNANFTAAVLKVVNTFAIPASSRAVGALVYPQLNLMGPTIQASVASKPARISDVSRNLTTGETLVTIADGTITGSGTVTFGNIVYTSLNTTRLTLPETVDFDNLFLGQAVTGVGIAPGTVIAAIDRESFTVKFADDKKMTRTGFTAITFGIGGRNIVTHNRTGIVLAGGATTVTNSTITANTFNAIEISRSGATVDGRTLQHRIGTSLAPTIRSNQIHSNGGWGVFFTAAMNDPAPNPDTRKDLVIIQGNYLGTTSPTVVSSTLANRKRSDGSTGNIGHVVSGTEVIFAGLASRLLSRSIDGLDALNNQHGRYQGAGGGTGGGVLTPAAPDNPARRRR